jgi:hypothetical protein
MKAKIIDGCRVAKVAKTERLQIEVPAGMTGEKYQAWRKKNEKSLNEVRESEPDPDKDDDGDSIIRLAA